MDAGSGSRNTLLTVRGTVRGASVEVKGDDLDVRGAVHADQLGYASNMGPGAGEEPESSPVRCAGKDEAMTGYGGTHGGIGGDSCAASLACSTKPKASRETYGSVTAPRSCVVGECRAGCPRQHR